MKWLLVIVFTAPNGSIDVEQIEFPSQETCVIEGTKLTDKFDAEALCIMQPNG